MDIHDALDRACGEVSIIRPSHYREGQWAKTDTTSGRNGKGDGRVIVDERKVTAWNWQTGEKATVWFGDETVKVDRSKLARQRAEAKADQRQRADRAADRAARLLAGATLTTHPYLARKGFAAEKAPVIDAPTVAAICGTAAVPDGGERAIVLPARVGPRVTSAQLIWEDGTKRFLFGGEMGGAAHRIAAGRDTWLCEGFATALSLRAALRAMSRHDAIAVCFSASNIAVVARTIRTRCWIAADHDKPLDQFDGIGTGEHYARQAGAPYAMPPVAGTDFNDMHQHDGLFAVQRVLSETIRRGGR